MYKFCLFCFVLLAIVITVDYEYDHSSVSNLPVYEISLKHSVLAPKSLLVILKIVSKIEDEPKNDFMTCRKMEKCQTRTKTVNTKKRMIK
jgi:hypothetical protein